MTDLRQAAMLALEALEQSTPNQRDGDDDYCEVGFSEHRKAITALREALEQAEQEPVVDCPRCGHVCSQRPWVGLTDDEIDDQAKKDDHGVYFALGALWAEAKLKERNT